MQPKARSKAKSVHLSKMLSFRMKCRSLGIRTPGTSPSAWDRHPPAIDTGVTELLARCDRPASSCCGDTPQATRALPPSDGEGAATGLDTIRGKNSSREGEKRTKSIDENSRPTLPVVDKSRVLSQDIRPPCSVQHRPRVLTTAIRQEKETEQSLVTGPRTVGHRGSHEEDT